jgi:hypothetical protein
MEIPSEKSSAPLKVEDDKPQDPDRSITKPAIHGSCACGSTTWQSDSFPTRLNFCYCGTCRRISGGAFIAFIDLPTSSVTFPPPEITSASSSASPSASTLKIVSISSNAHRGFCSQCGSSLMMVYHTTKETLFLSAASVSEEVSGSGKNALKDLPGKHIYVEDKVDWYSLPDDGLPRHERMPNEAKYLVHKD